MSQQDFYPQSEENKENADIPVQPYYWSTKQKTGDMPKNEHPSTFEESIPPYGYKAQDTASSASSASSTQKQQSEQRSGATYEQRTHQRKGFSPDGDAFETGYRPYATMQQQYAPPWARPQRNRMGPWRWIILIALGFIFLRPLLWIAGILIAAIGVLFGAVLLAVLLPVIIIVALLAVFSVMALIVMAVLGIPFRPWRWRGYRGRWRGGRSW